MAFQSGTSSGALASTSTDSEGQAHDKNTRSVWKSTLLTWPSESLECYWFEYTIMFSIKVKSYEISTILVCYFCMSFLFFQGETVQTYLKNNQWEKWQLISITIGFNHVVNLTVKWGSVDSHETIWRESMWFSRDGTKSRPCSLGCTAGFKGHAGISDHQPRSTRGQIASNSPFIGHQIW